jgi:hypothetical protein
MDAFCVLPDGHDGQHAGNRTDRTRHSFDVTDAERRAIESARTAHAIVGGDPILPYDITGLAAEVERLRDALERERTVSDGLRASLSKMREDGDRALRERSVN